MENILMLQNDLFRLRIALVDDPLYLAVDIGGNTLAVGSRMRKISSDEHLVIITALVDHSKLLRHTVLGPHRPGDRGCLLDVLGGTGGHITEDDLLSDPSAKGNHDGL